MTLLNNDNSDAPHKEDSSKAPTNNALTRVAKWSAGKRDSGNMLIHGDNLETLNRIRAKFSGRIRCVFARELR